MNKRIATLWKFLTYDIWRITEDEVTKTTFSLYNIIKTIYLCINRFTKDRLVNGGYFPIRQFLFVANQERHIHRGGFNHVIVDGAQPD